MFRCYMKKTLFGRRIKALIIDIIILIVIEILLIISFILVVDKDFLFIYYMTGSIVYGILYIATKGQRLGDILCKTKVISTLNHKIEYRYNPFQIIICVIAVIIITVSVFYGLWIILNWLVS